MTINEKLVQIRGKLTKIHKPKPNAHEIDVLVDVVNDILSVLETMGDTYIVMPMETK